ncbi:MAG TPA: VWA domain-containing protein [Thermoanaerobaculia bacterium]|nr:VWA domain-containing protein [Thermoanaerobaculia bacterium]
MRTIRSFQIPALMALALAAGALIGLAPALRAQPVDNAHVVPSPVNPAPSNPPAESKPPEKPPDQGNQGNPPAAAPPAAPAKPPAQPAAPATPPAAPATPPATQPAAPATPPAAAAGAAAAPVAAAPAGGGKAAATPRSTARAATPAKPAAAAAPAATTPQEGADQPLPSPLFGESIEVRVVNLEAVVTDKDGHRVPDLQLSDFRLRVDGKPLPVQYFTEVRGGQAIVPSAGGPAETAVPGLPDLAPGSPVGTSYLVFIDDFFSVETRRNEVLRALKDNLSHLAPEDRMALVAFDGRHLHMLSSWTSSHQVLAKAIEREIGERAHGVDRLAEQHSWESNRRLNPFRNGGGAFIAPGREGFAGHLDIEEEAFVDLLAGQVRRAVDAAVSTMRGFASPPGRKVMLVLAGGWPFSPADWVVNDINRPVLEKMPQGEDLLRPLVENANRLGYTLYPVDVPGIETQTVDASSATPAGDPLASASTGVFGIREQEHKGTLMFLADRTGGKPLLNSLRMAALTRVEEDTRSYYWLGFTPTWKGDDKSHKVQLEVLRPGLKVRSRDSYLDRSRKSEVTMMVESAMLFGNAPGAQTMPVKLGQWVKSGRHEIELTVTLAIPVSAMTTVPINGKYASEVELRIAALDERGMRSEVPVVPLQLSSKEPPANGKFVRYETKLKLRRINQHLMFAIFDPLSNKITTAEADIKL